MRYNNISSQMFINNRKSLIESLEKESIAIINSNDQMPRNGDQLYPFRQNSDLFYLCGIEQEKTILLLCPFHNNKKFHEVLFVIKPNKSTEIWEGHKYSKEEAQNISGIKTIYWLEEFNAVFRELALGAKNIYLNSNEYTKFSTELDLRDSRFIISIKKLFPNHNYIRLAPEITKLRTIKSPAEIELIKKACEITKKAFFRVLQFANPGVYEFEIEAEMSHEFTINRSSGHAYAPIVGSGINACTLHYIENNCECISGDLILMDFGAEYANYAADCTRTIPVNGKFSTRQKQIYNSVLFVLKKAMKLMAPGMTINKLNKKVTSIMENELVKIGLLTKEQIKSQNPENPAVTQYLMHGVSHFLGLDVHDVGSKDEPFKPGMVLTCEPGIYIEEEKTGIRLENDILITQDGNINLTESIPVEINEIEKIMKR
ncbi:MAG: M24 family metallopeptidase [Chlorobi bacterium]|nr:M24 family metallopeptidase [Chlorobiota bacterium]